ncbi:MAG: hypothetical protein ACHQ01_10145 [Candidatus Limnocylindrales bacterium]
MQTRRTLRSGTALLLGLAVMAAACGSGIATALPSGGASAGATPSSATPSAAGSTGQSDQAVYATIERQVEALRELRPTSTVTPVLLDSQGLRDWLTKANAAQTDHVALANESRLFADLGLIPAGSSLEQMELDLEAGQVVGFYDPVSKGLYVLSQSGGVGPTQKLTFSHEYTHALQDQNFGLDKLATSTADEGDRDLARIALPEGDATLLMTMWMQQNLSMVELLQVAGESLSGPQSDQLAKAPEILRQTLTFPYDQGLAFVQGIYSTGGWAAVDKLYASPPDSTSQILHPELYAAGVKPVALTVPPAPASLGSGWKLTMQDTLGEFQLGVWLEGQNPTSAATTAAQSATSTWAGDRVGLYESPDGAWAVVLDTAWRTAGGEAAFVQAATPKTAGLPGPAVVCANGNDVGVYVASTVNALEAFAPCRPPL